MTSAIIMLALLTAMEGRQFRSGTAARVDGNLVDAVGDGPDPWGDGTIATDDELAIELHVAMFGDWTLDTSA
jgi:hypothetical protein